jgi:hypothetical protein
LQVDPDAVAQYADYPVSELDLHARHRWLVNQRADVERLLSDPEWFDAKAAGWWAWGACAWIGSGWCSGDGPWTKGADGELVKLPHLGNAGQGINRKLPHLGDAGQGINRQLPWRSKGVSQHAAGIAGLLSDLSGRLRGVRVCSGSWDRVLGDSCNLQ